MRAFTIDGCISGEFRRTFKCAPQLLHKICSTKPAAQAEKVMTDYKLDEEHRRAKR